MQFLAHCPHRVALAQIFRARPASIKTRHIVASLEQDRFASTATRVTGSQQTQGGIRTPTLAPSCTLPMPRRANTSPPCDKTILFSPAPYVLRLLVCTRLLSTACQCRETTQAIQRLGSAKADSANLALTYRRHVLNQVLNRPFFLGSHQSHAATALLPQPLLHGC